MSRLTTEEKARRYYYLRDALMHTARVQRSINNAGLPHSQERQLLGNLYSLTHHLTLARDRYATVAKAEDER